MTAATISQSSLTHVRDRANAWLTTHHQELMQRARYRLRRMRRRDRQEAIAEVMAMVAVYVHSAAERHRLESLTPYWLVEYASRNFINGRRTGGRGQCVMSPAVQMQKGFTMRSIDEPLHDVDEDQPRRLRDSLADRAGVGPADQCRIAHDYPVIFEIEDVPEKPRKVFMFLSETDGDGSQSALARELRISPARVTQCKREVGQALARHGYRGPLGPRPVGPNREAADCVTS